ncbi:MAG: hypothetical protein PHQ62_00480 [Clostridia bacterium]|nr:hypothetical protein [Clostridia bacterium]
MKKFGFAKILLAIVCVSLACTTIVYAFSERLRLQYLMGFNPNYKFTISLSTDGINYQNIYDNSGQITISENNFTITPEINNEIKIANSFSNLAQIVYIKIFNHTLNTTLEATVSSLSIYETTAEVSGITSQTAVYNATSSAITIDLGTGINAEDNIIIGLTISN